MMPERRNRMAQDVCFGIHDGFGSRPEWNVGSFFFFIIPINNFCPVFFSRYPIQRRRISFFSSVLLDVPFHLRLNNILLISLSISDISSYLKKGDGPVDGREDPHLGELWPERKYVGHEWRLDLAKVL